MSATPEGDVWSPGGALADPVVEAAAHLAARRATAWGGAVKGPSSSVRSQGSEARWVLLEGEVRFRLGAYGFRADRAVVRIDTISKPGERIRHLAVYLDHARPLTEHGMQGEEHDSERAKGEGKAEQGRASPGMGGITAEAPRLLVTASTRGKLKLSTDLFDRAASPPRDPLVSQAAARITRRRDKLRHAVFTGRTQPLFSPAVLKARQTRRAQVAREQLLEQVRQLPGVEPNPTSPNKSPNKSRNQQPPAAAAPGEPSPSGVGVNAAANAPSSGEPGGPVLPTTGTVYLSADRIANSPKQHAIMLIGHVRVVYQDYRHDRNVALTAQRVVLFTRGNVGRAAGTGNLKAGKIRGVYLENHVVITDNQLTVRAPRMYFDLARNKAILLNAVLYTFDVKRHIPLYMRAEVVRQTSATSFEANHALLTTSEFAVPHVSIGADHLTVRRLRPEGGANGRAGGAGGGGKGGQRTSAGGDGGGGNGGATTEFTAAGDTLRIGKTPVFYWPYLAGTNNNIPIRKIAVDHSSQNGTEVLTTWDLFSLAGRQAPQGVDLLLRADYLGDHGPAAGVKLDYDRPTFFGNFNSYLAPIDSGTDDLTDNRDVEHDNDFRGMIHWQDRHYLQHGLELSLEASYISDPTFLEEYFQPEAFEAKEYETSAYLKKQKNDSALTLLASYHLNDFTPQYTTLQAPGYRVDKLPELGYYRVGASLWDDRLTYFSENRLSRVRLRFGFDSPADRGFDRGDARRVFGFEPGLTFNDAAHNQGLPSDWVDRLDTRHEIDLPLEASIFDVTPYLAGRLTAYDNDFPELAGETSQIRLWGSVGARAHTQFSATYDGFDSRLFNVHRLRHIIEPEVDVFYQGTTINRGDLPVYDPDVEGINNGPGVRIGLTNTLQTKRGGPGRWRSVDWIKLRTDFVFQQKNNDRVTPFGNARLAALPDFIDYRPEYSTGGDHFYTQLLWLVSDTLGVTGDLTYSFENDRVASWRVSANLDHTPRLSSHLSYQEINVLDLKLISYGFTYQLTTKYRLGVNQRIDFGQGGNRRVNAFLERALPRWRLRFVASYDEIDDDTTVGLVLVPQGIHVASPTLPLDQIFSPF